MAIKKISKSELENKYQYHLSVGRLKEFIAQHNIPDTAKLLIQRVEDTYYENHNWGVYLKEGQQTFKDPDGNIVPESLEQYHPAWCCVNHQDEDNVLFINLHY